MKSYRVAADARHPRDVEALGRLVAVGEVFSADLESDHDKALLKEGVLIRLPADAVDYEAKTMRELEGELARRGIEVQGTGADGNVLKSDAVAALKADDEEGS